MPRIMHRVPWEEGDDPKRSLPPGDERNFPLIRSLVEHGVVNKQGVVQKEGFKMRRGFKNGWYLFEVTWNETKQPICLPKNK